MKSFIVDFKMDWVNSVPQNSPFFTPRCRIQVWATIGQGDRHSADQVVKSPEHTLFSLTQFPVLLQLRIFKGSSPPPPTGLPAFRIPSSGPNKLWRAASSEELRKTKQVSTELLSLQRKGATSFLLCRLLSNCSSIDVHVHPCYLVSLFSTTSGHHGVGWYKCSHPPPSLPFALLSLVRHIRAKGCMVRKVWLLLHHVGHSVLSVCSLRLCCLIGWLLVAAPGFPCALWCISCLVSILSFGNVVEAEH